MVSALVSISPLRFAEVLRTRAAVQMRRSKKVEGLSLRTPW